MESPFGNIETLVCGESHVYFLRLICRKLAHTPVCAEVTFIGVAVPEFDVTLKITYLGIVLTRFACSYLVGDLVLMTCNDLKSSVSELTVPSVFTAV